MGDEQEGSFWNEVPAVNVDRVLESEAFSLEDVLDQDDVIAQCRCLNSQLVSYLSNPSIIAKLIQYIITPQPFIKEEDMISHSSTQSSSTNQPNEISLNDENQRQSEDSTQQHAHRVLIPQRPIPARYPYIATEILACEVEAILSTLVQDNNLLELLFSFLDTDLNNKDKSTDKSSLKNDESSSASNSSASVHPHSPEYRGLDPSCVGYFRRVITVLVQRKFQALVTYVQEFNVVDKLVRHIGLTSILEVLVLVGWEASENVDWLFNQGLIPKLVQCLPTSKTPLSPLSASISSISLPNSPSGSLSSSDKNTFSTNTTSPDTTLAVSTTSSSESSYYCSIRSEVYINATKALVDIILKYQYPKTSKLLSQIQNPIHLNHIIQFMLSGLPGAFVAAAPIIIVLITRDISSRLEIVLEDGVEDTSELPFVVQLILDNLDKLLDVLHVPKYTRRYIRNNHDQDQASKSSHETKAALQNRNHRDHSLTSADEIKNDAQLDADDASEHEDIIHEYPLPQPPPPFGEARLKCVDILFVLFRCNYREVNRKLVSSHVLALLLDLFLLYEWNNMLHVIVEKIIHCVLDDSESKELQADLFGHAQLLHKSLIAYDRNETMLQLPKRGRLGYMGHLFGIMDVIPKVCESNPYIRDLVDEVVVDHNHPLIVQVSSAPFARYMMKCAESQEGKGNHNNNNKNSNNNDNDNGIRSNDTHTASDYSCEVTSTSLPDSGSNSSTPSNIQVLQTRTDINDRMNFTEADAPSSFSPSENSRDEPNPSKNNNAAVGTSTSITISPVVEDKLDVSCPTDTTFSTDSVSVNPSDVKSGAIPAKVINAASLINGSDAPPRLWSFLCKTFVDHEVMIQSIILGGYIPNESPQNDNDPGIGIGLDNDYDNDNDDWKPIHGSHNDDHNDPEPFFNMHMQHTGDGNNKINDIDDDFLNNNNAWLSSWSVHDKEAGVEESDQYQQQQGNHQQNQSVHQAHESHTVHQSSLDAQRQKLNSKKNGKHSQFMGQGLEDETYQDDDDDDDDDFSHVYGVQYNSAAGNQSSPVSVPAFFQRQKDNDRKNATASSPSSLNQSKLVFGSSPNKHTLSEANGLSVPSGKSSRSRLNHDSSDEDDDDNHGRGHEDDVDDDDDFPIERVMGDLSINTLASNKHNNNANVKSTTVGTESCSTSNQDDNDGFDPNFQFPNVDVNHPAMTSPTTGDTVNVGGESNSKFNSDGDNVQTGFDDSDDFEVTFPDVEADADQSKQVVRTPSAPASSPLSPSALNQLGVQSTKSNQKFNSAADDDEEEADIDDNDNEDDDNNQPIVNINELNAQEMGFSDFNFFKRD
jgi:hypothetical protein